MMKNMEKLNIMKVFGLVKKELSINGKSFYKVGKNKYSYGSGEDLIEAYLIGNFISGVKVIIGNDSIQVIPKTKVYEWILAFIPFIFILKSSNFSLILERPST